MPNSYPELDKYKKLGRIAHLKVEHIAFMVFESTGRMVPGSNIPESRYLGELWCTEVEKDELISLIKECGLSFREVHYSDPDIEED